MTALVVSLRQTLGSLRMVGLLYGITLGLGLLVTIPFYTTLLAEDQNSPAFLTLLTGFDYTIFSDFMQRSGPAMRPLMSVGRWTGILYVLLSVFFAGGILSRFADVPFSMETFWAACSRYVGRFLRLFGVVLLVTLVNAGIWLVAGSLVSVGLSDTLTERGLFWVGLAFFCLFCLSAMLVFCIGDYAKVILFRDDQRSVLRAFGLASRLVLRNPGKTYGLYLLLIGMGTAFFAFYFLLDSLILMSGWLTILLMFVIQQVLIFGRVGLKVWALGTAYTVYDTLPKPQPVLRSVPVQEPTPPAENPSPAVD